VGHFLVADHLLNLLHIDAEKQAIDVKRTELAWLLAHLGGPYEARA
jgi:hypothetical protein